MIELFEEFTYSLTEYEETVLLPLFLRGFAAKLGPDKAVTSREIITKLELFKLPGKLTGARVRKIVNYIRMTGLVPGLMASSRGYYISKDPAEIESYIRSLNGRLEAIRGIRSKMEEYRDFLNYKK